MKVFFEKNSVVLLVFTLLTAIMLLAGCTPPPYEGYQGEFPELCSVAWAKIPFLDGYKYPYSGGDPYASSLETDSYGRVLFFYSEDTENEKGYIAIMQRTDGTNAYYYPDDCYVPITRSSADEAIDLNTSEIASLKESSDWGLPLNEEKCKATKIDKFPIPGELGLTSDFFENLMREYYEYSGRYIHPKNENIVYNSRYVMSDYYGRELYYVRSFLHEYSPKTEIVYDFSFLIVVNPDKSYDISTVVFLEGENDPREDVKWIKEKTGWNVAP